MARALRLGLAAVIMIATVACGSATPPGSTGPAATGAANGAVALPAGGTIDRSKLAVVSPFGTAAVGADGSFAVPAGPAGPTLVDVTDAAGKIVLLGFVDPGKAASSLSAATTAHVLLFWALGGFTVPGDAFGQVVELIGAAPEAAGLATTLEARLAAAPTLITDGDAAALAAVLSARDAILSRTEASAAKRAPWSAAGLDADTSGPAIAATLAVSARAGGNGDGSVVDLSGAPNVIIDEAVPKSGIEILPNPDGSGIVVQNSRRRDVALFAYQVGSQDANGVRTDLDAPVLVGQPHPVPATRALNMVVSTLDAFSSAGRSAWAPVLSDPIDLPLIAGSTRTFYVLVAIGPSADPSDVPTLFTTTRWFGQVDQWKKTAHDLGCAASSASTSCRC